MDRKRIKSEDNTEINKIIGTNLRFCRTLAGKNQTKLGIALGDVKFQQIQKYESGTNGMSAYRLWKASKYLNVPMEAFFDPDYIKKMKAVHEAKYFHNGGIKPKDFFNVYSYQKEIEEELDKLDYEDHIKGRTPADAGYLKPQSDIGSMEEITPTELQRAINDGEDH